MALSLSTLTHPHWCDPNSCFTEMYEDEVLAIYHRSHAFTITVGTPPNPFTTVHLVQVHSNDPDADPSGPMVAWGDRELTVGEFSSAVQQLGVFATYFPVAIEMGGEDGDPFLAGLSPAEVDECLAAARNAMPAIVAEIRDRRPTTSDVPAPHEAAEPASEAR